MKNFNFLVGLGAVALAAGLSSCSSDEPSMGKIGAGETAISLTSSVNSSRSADVNLQRIQIANGVKVGAFVTSGENTIAANAQLTADGNGALAGEIGNYPVSGTVSVYAYAPFNSAWALDAANTFSVAADQSLDEGYLASDLLRGIPEGENSFAEQEAPIALKFGHMLAKVNVKVNKGTSDVELAGASVSLVNAKTQTTLNVLSGEVGEASGEATEVKAVEIDVLNVDCAGSVIIVPQEVAAGDFVKILTADNRTILARLASPVTFKSGKAYTYTVNLAGSGPAVTASISVNTSITDWEDDEDLAGDGNEQQTPVTYEVGDYILKDGSLMKAAAMAAATDDVKANAAAVIFSTTVSSADATAGYAGYAVSLGGRKGNTRWYDNSENGKTPELLRSEACSSFALAVADMDGLSLYNLIQTQEDKDSYKAFEYSSYNNSVMSIAADNVTGWFVPSFGQFLAILNNLGNANYNPEGVTINHELEITEGVKAIMDAVNSHKVGQTDIIEKAGKSIFYATSSESDATHIWGITLNDTEGNDSWKISKSAGKTNSGRSVLPICAYKLK